MTLALFARIYATLFAVAFAAFGLTAILTLGFDMMGRKVVRVFNISGVLCLTMCGGALVGFLTWTAWHAP